MPTKHRVRTLMESQHVKGSETLLKFSSKDAILVASGILRLLVNILAPNEMYCLSVKTSI